MQSLTGLLQADPAPLPDDAGRRRIALQLGEALGLTIYANSVSFARGSCFALGRVGVEKRLVAVAEQAERLVHGGGMQTVEWREQHRMAQALQCPGHASG